MAHPISCTVLLEAFNIVLQFGMTAIQLGKIRAGRTFRAFPAALQPLFLYADPQGAFRRTANRYGTGAVVTGRVAFNPRQFRENFPKGGILQKAGTGFLPSVAL